MTSLDTKPLDRVFREWRIRKIRPYIKQGVRLLDVGCGDGVVFRRLQPLIKEGVGIDSDLDRVVDRGYYRLVPGMFPDDVPQHTGSFDVITMLAVLEHIPPERQPHVARRCAMLLAPSGRLIITVPSPAVDQILHVLRRIPFLYEGRSLHQHYGFDAANTPSIFSALTLLKAEKFQLGLNNLFVFQKSP